MHDATPRKWMHMNQAECALAEMTVEFSHFLAEPLSSAAPSRCAAR